MNISTQKSGHPTKKNSFLLTTTAFFGILLVSTICSSLNLVTYAESNDTEWHLTITGLVQQPLNITLIDLFAMPQTSTYASLICAGPPTYTVTEGNWTGVKLWLILQEAEVLNGTVKVAFYAKDGYTTDLTLETAQQSDVLLAYGKDGEPLKETLRLVVPGQWGYKWISQLTAIELVDYDFLGAYESRGYPDNGIGTPYIGPYTVAPDILPPISPSQLTNANPAKASTSFTSANPSPMEASSPSSSTPSSQPEQLPKKDKEGFLPMRFFYALTAIAIAIIIVIIIVVSSRLRLIKTRPRNHSSSLKNASNSMKNLTLCL